MTTNSAVSFLLFSMLLLPIAHTQDRRLTPAGGGRRLALIIGNDEYSWKRLVNSVNDARALAAALPKVGFDPRDISLATNATISQLRRVSREFIEKLRPDDVALVYYAGHGVEVRGENFLIPVDFPANATELELQDEAYSAQQLLRNLEASQARVRLLILDTCRDNPLRAARSAGAGLARMDGKGTLIVFATSAGSTAADNPRGGNGLFTSHLLRALPTPGLPVDQMIKQVAREVYQDSHGEQMPTTYGMLLEDFDFVPGNAPAQHRSGPAVDAPDPEVAAWTAIQNSENSAAIEEFLHEFPNGRYAGAARVKLAALRPPAGKSGDTAGARTRSGMVISEFAGLRYGDSLARAKQLFGAPLRSNPNRGAHTVDGRDFAETVIFGGPVRNGSYPGISLNLDEAQRIISVSVGPDGPDMVRQSLGLTYPLFALLGKPVTAAVTMLGDPDEDVSKTWLHTWSIWIEGRHGVVVVGCLGNGYQSTDPNATCNAVSVIWPPFQ